MDSDDTTPANQLTYEVHLAEGGDFSPSASTLKFSGKNVLSTQLTGLKAATSYSVKLVAVDAQGAKTVSAVKSVTTLSDTVADFTKISSTGQKLPVNATSWSCVLANRTGLMWEVKTDDTSGTTLTVPLMVVLRDIPMMEIIPILLSEP